MKRKQLSNIYLIFVAAFLICPLIVTFIYSVFREWSEIIPKNFSLASYIELFRDHYFWLAILKSIIISIIPTFICMVITLLVMYICICYKPKYKKYFNVLCVIPYAIQGVILPNCILSIYGGTNIPIFNNNYFMIFGAYMIIVLPYVYQGIKNGVDSVDCLQLIEAAELLGCSKFQAFYKIIVPSIKKDLKLTILLIFSIIFGDFIVVNTLLGSQYETAQLYLYNQMKISGQQSSAIVIILFLITLTISIILLRNNDER